MTMRHPLAFKVACVGVAAMWVTSTLVAVLHLSPWVEVPWWLLIMRSPMSSGTTAAAIVGLVYWRFGAPGSTIWRVAYRAGWCDGARDASSGKVVPLPRRREMAD